MQRKVWLSILGGAIALVVAVGIVWTRGGRSASGAAESAHAPERVRAVSAIEPADLAQDIALARSIVQPLFDILDCDAGGNIDPSEVSEHLGQIFTPLDRDRSRSLTQAEYVRAYPSAERRRREAVFELIDKNGDNVVSPREYASHIQAMIELVDTNRDGEVWRDELTATRAADGRRAVRP